MRCVTIDELHISMDEELYWKQMHVVFIMGKIARLRIEDENENQQMSSLKNCPNCNGRPNRLIHKGDINYKCCAVRGYIGKIDKSGVLGWNMAVSDYIKDEKENNAKNNHI